MRTWFTSEDIKIKTIVKQGPEFIGFTFVGFTSSLNLKISAEK